MLLLPVQPDLRHSTAERSPSSPPLANEEDERSEHDRGSWRSLEVVGRAAVLGAMVEQRKRSSSAPPPPPPNDDVFQKIR
jgi:hypothetical protein